MGTIILIRNHGFLQYRQIAIKAEFVPAIYFFYYQTHMVNIRIGIKAQLSENEDVNLNQEKCTHWVTGETFLTMLYWNDYFKLRPSSSTNGIFRMSVCPSVCLSVCLSVRPSHLLDYVPIIVSSWNFQELLPVTEVTSMQKVKVRGQRSRAQRSQPNFTVSGL